MRPISDRAPAAAAGGRAGARAGGIDGGSAPPHRRRRRAGFPGGPLSGAPARLVRDG